MDNGSAIEKRKISIEVAREFRQVLKEEFGVELSLDQASEVGSAWIQYLDLILIEQRKPPN